MRAIQDNVRCPPGRCWEFRPGRARRSSVFRRALRVNGRVWQSEIAPIQRTPCPSRDRARGMAQRAAVAPIQRNMVSAQKIAPNVPAPQAQIRPTPEATMDALRRRNAKPATPTIMEARRQAPALSTVQSAGEMDIPCNRYGPLRRPVESARISTC